MQLPCIALRRDYMYVDKNVDIHSELLGIATTYMYLSHPNNSQSGPSTYWLETCTNTGGRAPHQIKQKNTDLLHGQQVKLNEIKA